MLSYLLQNGYENIAQQIWEILKAHPGEFAAIWIAISIGLILFFAFIIHRMNYGFALLCFVAGFILTILLVLALFSTPATTLVLHFRYV